MKKQFTAATVYFAQEGKDNLEECLRIAFQTAKDQGVGKLVIFTGRGDGVRMAIDSYLSQPQYQNIKLVAVTFPAGKTFTSSSGEPVGVELSQETLELLRGHSIPIVRAHLPFDPIAPLYRQSGNLGQDLCLVGEALSMFCGSMSLCVQAIALACDAGAVSLGEHVIALTSDTAILAQASSTRRMLGELVIREILCKPVIMTIGRHEIPPSIEEHKEEVTIVATIPAEIEKNLCPRRDLVTLIPGRTRLKKKNPKQNTLGRFVVP